MRTKKKTILESQVFERTIPISTPLPSLVLECGSEKISLVKAKRVKKKNRKGTSKTKQYPLSFNYFFVNFSKCTLHRTEAEISLALNVISHFISEIRKIVRNKRFIGEEKKLCLLLHKEGKKIN